MRGMRSGYFLAAALVLVCVGLALAGEPTCDTFITGIPSTISAQGHYCLANNVATASTSGAAITIDANSVVLDLRGYKIGGQAAGVGTTTIGVHVLEHSTVVIRNGLIRGFRAAVYFEDGAGNNNNIVEDINADSNTVYGIYVGAGANNTIRNCIVGNTGGTTLATPPQPHGIGLFSNASFATNNTVTGTVAAFPAGLEYYGLRVFAATGVRVVNNQVIGDGNTANPSNHCFVFTGAPTTIYKDNIASGCGTNYSSGIAVGTTNHP